MVGHALGLGHVDDVLAQPREHGADALGGLGRGGGQHVGGGLARA